MEPQYATKADADATTRRLFEQMERMETNLLLEFRASSARLEAIVRISFVEAQVDDLKSPLS